MNLDDFGMDTITLAGRLRVTAAIAALSPSGWPTMSLA